MSISNVLKPCSPWRYDIVAENLFHPDLGEYCTYGIRITTDEYTEILHDVSVCKKTSERIIKYLNRLQVSPVHLNDIVMDMLP